eukprot:846313-Pleurochrysis_carterae.AAC.1
MRSETGPSERREQARARYTCDASAKTASVHAKHNEMERDGFCRNVCQNERRARFKKVINGSWGQNAR